MPWTNNDYPNSMKNLDSEVREKAIEIANALLEDGYEDSRAIPIAIDQAKDFAETHSQDSVIYEVKPHEDGWQVIKSGSKRASSVFETKQEAFEKAKQLSEKNHGRVEQYKKDGTFQKS